MLGGAALASLPASVDTRHSQPTTLQGVAGPAAAPFPRLSKLPQRVLLRFCDCTAFGHMRCCVAEPVEATRTSRWHQQATLRRHRIRSRRHRFVGY